jgi:hypothetical protein
MPFAKTQVMIRVGGSSTTCMQAAELLGALQTLLDQPQDRLQLGRALARQRTGGPAGPSFPPSHLAASHAT